MDFDIKILFNDDDNKEIIIIDEDGNIIDNYELEELSFLDDENNLISIFNNLLEEDFE